MLQSPPCAIRFAGESSVFRGRVMSSTRVSRRTVALLCFAAVSVCSSLGCGSSTDKLYPVRGRVLCKGQPMAGAIVYFQLVGGDVNRQRPYGTADANGEFTLSTHPVGPGAPP